MIRLHDNQSAFTEIYQRYANQLLELCYSKVRLKEIAEEIVQISFVKLWIARKELKINYSLKAYLYTAAKNNIISFYYRNLHKTLSLDDVCESLLPSATETQNKVDGSLLNKFYEDALQDLPQKCRDVFVMSRTGYSMKEIAAVHNISVKTVEVHIGKALKLLREKFKTSFYSFFLAILFFDYL